MQENDVKKDFNVGNSVKKNYFAFKNLICYLTGLTCLNI